MVVMTVKAVKVMRQNLSMTMAANFQSPMISTSWMGSIPNVRDQSSKKVDHLSNWLRILDQIEI
jgi:hypothetical protein